VKKHFCIAAMFAAVAMGQQTGPTARQIAGRIKANDLKADVSFLASDALKGRGTPSAGLDIAAEYIAAQFRRAGLEPAGDDGYFQNAPFESRTPNQDGLQLTLDIGGRRFDVNSASMRIMRPGAVDLRDAVMKVVDARPMTVSSEEKPGSPEPPGRPLLVNSPSLTTRAGAPLIVWIPQRGIPQGGTYAPALAPAGASGQPILAVSDAELRAALDAAPDAEVKITAHIPAPKVEPVVLRNVVGVLRGADPALKSACLVISAHYDHLGTRAITDGDGIFNGANDDASGTATVIAIANALAAMPRPKRSIVFLAMFGEEQGGLGSAYYVKHPVFPLAKTIAEINLEQLGRTDDAQGPRLRQFNLTGFDFTTLAAVFQAAGKEAGVRAVNDPKLGGPYFSRSDNVKFADAGIPSTTISVTYMFPDYHNVGDEWPKLDYGNMAKVDAAIALAAWRLAEAAAVPQWNRKNPATTRYIRARP
jgi:hypothetical protein